MPPAPSSLVSDPLRLAALSRYEILDTPAEPGFDDIVHLACRLCAVPVALVSFVAGDRQWFKARAGFPACETDLDRSVCAHALDTPGDLLVIPDLTADPRTRDNPLVTGDPHIRFYAGAPLVTPEGQALGSLCVIDKVPRPAGLTPLQAEDLKALARQVMTQLELRRAVALRDQARAAEASKDSYWRGMFDRLSEGFHVGEIVRDAEGRAMDWRYREVNPAWGRLLGIDPATVIGRTVRDVIPDVEDEWIDEYAKVVDTGRPSGFTRRVETLGKWYEGRAFKLDGDLFGVIFLEVTARVEAETRRNALLTLGDRLRDLTTIPEMTLAAAEIVGRTLNASRAGFGQIVDDVEYVDIEADWTMPGVASIAGRHRFDDFGDIRGHLRRGQALVVDDVATDPRTRDDHGMWQAIQIGSLVNMPVRERGHTVAVFIVQDIEPREWKADDLSFLRNVADRVEAGVARVRAEDLQTVLNHELAHRLKNTLAVVQSMAWQTLRGVTEQELVQAFDRRVLALSRAHDVLLQKSWTAARMRAVMESVLSMQADLDRFALDGPDMDISPQAALSLSMLLHELATNALKYGALSASCGKVRVAWRTEESAAPTLVLDWTESGGPPVVAPPGQGGFGSKLIRMGLLGTRNADLRYRTVGLHAEFRAPLAGVQVQVH